MTQHTTIDCYAADARVLPTRQGSKIGRLWGAARRLVTALKHRMEVRRLSSFDERMLKDIGLNRSDVEDALSMPFSADPSEILVGRVRDRRFAHRHLLRSML